MKTPKMKEFLNNYTEKVFGKPLNDCKKELKCVICHASIDVNKFRDNLSIKEWTISGMCQKCQDKIFKKGEK